MCLTWTPRTVRSCVTRSSPIDGEGEGHLPIPDEPHVRNAIEVDDDSDVAKAAKD